eukprot:scaffold34200_cov112-Isochrysis_galbana.AAC.2
MGDLGHLALALGGRSTPTHWRPPQPLPQPAASLGRCKGVTTHASFGRGNSLVARTTTTTTWARSFSSTKMRTPEGSPWRGETLCSATRYDRPWRRCAAGGRGVMLFLTYPCWTPMVTLSGSRRISQRYRRGGGEQTFRGGPRAGCRWCACTRMGCLLGFLRFLSAALSLAGAPHLP